MDGSAFNGFVHTGNHWRDRSGGHHRCCHRWLGIPRLPVADMTTAMRKNRREPYGDDYCGACGESYADCKCQEGPTDSLHEVMRRQGTPWECPCCFCTLRPKG